MKRKVRCISSAAVIVFVAVCAVDFCIGNTESKCLGKYSESSITASEEVVKDYIHTNYVISEKNPWTDYSFYPITYNEIKVEQPNIDVKAKSAILVDYDTLDVLYEKDSQKKMYPASTTKLITALTVLQTMNENQIVTVGNEVNMIAPDSSKAGFRKGQIVTIRELMEGMLIASGNDAAYVLAKATGQAILEDNIANEGKKFSDSQCIERFMLEVNKNVRDMGLKNTNFSNPDGYDDEDQYTTAEDLSKIAIEAYENDIIADICGSKSKYSDTLEKTWWSTNELLNKSGDYYYKYCIGLKTGSTDKAGKCLVSIGKRQDKTCVSVVLNASTDEVRFLDSRTILKYGLEN